MENGHAKAKRERTLRAVVDTNVFVSGLFGKGTLAAALQALWIARDFELATSLAILREVAYVLYSPGIRRRFQPEEDTIGASFAWCFARRSSPKTGTSRIA